MGVGFVVPYVVTSVLDREALTLSKESSVALSELQRVVLLSAESLILALATGLTVHALGPGRLMVLLVLGGAAGAVVWAHAEATRRRGALSILPEGVRAWFSANPPLQWLGRWGGGVSDLALWAVVSVAWFVDPEGAQDVADVTMARFLQRSARGDPTRMVPAVQRETATEVATRIVAGRAAEAAGPLADRARQALSTDDWMLLGLGVAVAATGLQLTLSRTSRLVLHRSVAGLGLAFSLGAGALATVALFAREPLRDAVDFAIENRRLHPPGPPPRSPEVDEDDQRRPRAPVRRDPTPGVVRTVAAASLGSAAAGWLVQTSAAAVAATPVIAAAHAAASAFLANPLQALRANQ